MILVGLLAWVVLGIPVLALWGDGKRGRRLFILIQVGVFLLAVALAERYLDLGTLTAFGAELRVDVLSLILILLNSVVGLMTAWFSASYWHTEVQRHDFGVARQRLYHAMFQSFLATMLLALLSNNLGILWVALEGATL
jgi:hydrogenase-4 component F